MMSDGDILVHRYITQLNRKSPVRQAAETILAGQALSYGEVQTLLESLSRRPGSRWKEQVVAIWTLSHVILPEEDRHNALRLLTQILEKRPGRSVGCFIFAAWLIHFGLFWIGYVSWQDGKANRVREAAAIALRRIGDAESLDALVNAIMDMRGRAASGDKSVRIAAAMSLPYLLHRLPNQGYGYPVPAQTVPALCRLLSENKDEVVLSVLETLRILRPPDAIPRVEHIAKTHRSGHVRLEAAQTLALLQEEQRHAMLLRPSSAPGTPQDQLLRPAGYDVSDPNILLRPSSDKEEN